MAGPFKGLKILGFTTLLPRPFAAMMLADMEEGAQRINRKEK